MSPDETPRQVQFEFQHLFVSKGCFTVLETAANVTPSTEPAVVNLEVSADVRLSHTTGKGYLTLDFKILPDPTKQPYEIEVKIGAGFRTVDGSQEDLLAFCQQIGPTILFPYVREYVHRMTMDAPFGSIRLNPTNVAQLLNRTAWNVLETATPDATEPEQPSEQ
jgi:preprotein translocase subunit SecB